MKAGLDAAAVETVVGTILSAIQQEGDATKVGQLFSQLSGPVELAQQYVVTAGSGGGMLGALSGSQDR